MESDRLDKLLRHVDNVRRDCELLGRRLIKNKEEDLGLGLIKNGLIHDASKFSGIEWLHLHEESKDKSPELFLLAAKNHVTTNPHHPEYWNGDVKEMPRIYVAECVCDLHSRSSEFGNDLVTWVKDNWLSRYKLNTNCRIWREMKDFIDLLLEKPFK